MVWSQSHLSLLSTQHVSMLPVLCTTHCLPNMYATPRSNPNLVLTITSHMVCQQQDQSLRQQQQPKTPQTTAAMQRPLTATATQNTMATAVDWTASSSWTDVLSAPGLLCQQTLQSDNVIPAVMLVVDLCGAAGPQGSAMHVEGEFVNKVWMGGEPTEAEARRQKLGKAIQADHPPVCVE